MPKILFKPASWYVLFLALFLSNNFVLIRGILVIFAFGLIAFGAPLSTVLVLCLLLVLPFELEFLGIHIPVVTPNAALFRDGYGYHFGLTMRLVLSINIAAFFLIKKHRKLYDQSLTTTHLFLYAFFVLSAVSSLLAFNTSWSLTGLISIWEIVAVFTFFSAFFSNPINAKAFLAYLPALLGISGLIGTLQFLRSGSLGNVLELRTDTIAQSSSGLFTTDGTQLFRVSGMTSHATFFATFLSLLLPVVFALILKELMNNTSEFKKIIKTVALPVFSLLLGGVALVGTLSRSSWITVFASLMVLAVVFGRKISVTLPIKKSVVISIVGGVMMLLVVVFSGTISDRLSSISGFLLKGTGTGRAELLKKSLFLIIEYPVWGVGLNHFTYAMVKVGVSQEFAGFIFPVHNLYLLFFTEVGVLAGLSFTFFSLTPLVKTAKVVLKEPILLGFWLGAASFILNAQFHTLFNQGPALHFFMVYLAYLLAASTYGKNSSASLST